MGIVRNILTAAVTGSFVFAGGAMAQTATPINVSLTNYAFAPSVLSLKAGTTYRMHFTNDGSKEHNFNAPEFFKASQVAQVDKAKVEEGSVELDSGQAIDITVTPNRPGAYSFDCSHFMHSMLGMHGKIAVQ
jgi:plastocyanin